MAKEDAPARASSECIPCQVIAWDYRLKGMLNTVSEVAKIQLEGGSGWPGDEWGRKWYALIEATCGKMEDLLLEMTGEGDGRR